MTQTFQHWRVETDQDGIAWATLDRAEQAVNTLSRDVLTELNTLIDELVKSPVKGLAFLSGKEKGFIAGADVSQFTHIKTADEAFELIRQAQLIFDKLSDLPFPTVVCIDGFCLGGGYELSLACRYRIATDSADTKIGLPEVKLGIHPGWGGTVRLPRLVGPLKAMQAMLTGYAYSGRAMAKLGGVDACVPKRELKRAARYYLLKQPKPTEPKWYESALNNLPFARSLLGNVFYRQLKKKHVMKAHYPAPYAMVRNWIRDGAHGHAMVNEAKSIAELMVGDTARNLVRVFFLQQSLKDAAKGSVFKPRHVHVIGAGTMGGDIAAYCAYKGLYVTLQDQSPERIAPAMKRANKLYKKKLKKPRLIQSALDHLQPDVEGQGVARADIIIEAVFEDLKVKQDIFTHIEKHAKPSAILATNTSSIPLEQIASVMQDASRLVGIHFFNPVAKMPLVEVVRGDHTADTTVADAAKFVTKISRSPIVVKSRPGFLVNRILMPYLMEAMALLEDGYPATVIDDVAVKFGMPMGPITLADMVGLDVCLSVAKELTQAFGGSVPKRLEEMVAEGHFGVKSGRGFYEYKNGKPVKSADSSEPRDREIIQDRLMLIMVNEAVACLDEGVVQDADHLDIGMIFGTGFAPFRGGPMQYAKHRGMQDVYETLVSLHKRFGERFQPAQGWSQFVTMNPASSVTHHIESQAIPSEIPDSTSEG